MTMTDIQYSDGVTEEQFILRLLKDVNQLDSACDIAPETYTKSWPARYHLCHQRGNLLRFMNFSGLDVLEVGAGMGGVSRSIAERAKSLTVVEGTRARFDALSARLKDLTNWSGVVANVQDYAPSRLFDVVCVVGVLEYSAKFIDTDSADPSAPHAAFLAKVKTFLKPGGILVLAIENQMGLKYWNAATEDHLGSLFDGIVGYPFGKSARTFSKQALRELLAKAGWDTQLPFFPYPDYKVPEILLSEKFIQDQPRLAAHLATAYPGENYGRDRWRLFPDSLAALSLSEAGLLSDFSNSFLFVAWESATPQTADALLRHYHAGERAWWYQVEAPAVVLSESSSVAGESARARLSRHLYFVDAQSWRNEFLDHLKNPISAWIEHTFLDTSGGRQALISWTAAEATRVEKHPSSRVFGNLLGISEDLLFLGHTGGLTGPPEVLYSSICQELNILPQWSADLEAFRSLNPSWERAQAIQRFERAWSPRPVPRSPHQMLNPSPPPLPRRYQWLDRVYFSLKKLLGR